VHRVGLPHVTLNHLYTRQWRIYSEIVEKNSFHYRLVRMRSQLSRQSLNGWALHLVQYTLSQEGLKANVTKIQAMHMLYSPFSIRFLKKFVLGVENSEAILW